MNQHLTPEEHMLRLRGQIDAGLTCPLRDSSPKEIAQFNARHPGALFEVGDYLVYDRNTDMRCLDAAKPNI